MKARWEQRFDDRVDGVLMVDQVAMSYVLGATGPVEVGDYELTSGNVVEALLHQVYVVLTDTAVQDEYFKLTARTVFDRWSGARPTPSVLLQALARGGAERRLLVHSFDPAEQDLLAGTLVAGEHTSADADGPQVGLYLNDNTGAKMSYFLRTDVDVRRDLVPERRPDDHGHGDVPLGGAEGRGDVAAVVRHRRRRLRHRPRSPARRAADLRPGRRHHRRACHWTARTSGRCARSTTTAGRSRPSTPTSRRSRPRRSAGR